MTSALLLLGLCFGLACSDPYKQTLEPTNSKEYAEFVSAVKKLPTDEKNLIHAYIARKNAEGVQPVGITVREAIDDQRRHEAEMASLPGKIVDGVVKVAQALAPRPPAPLVVPLPSVPSPALTPPSASPAVVAPPALPSSPPSTASEFLLTGLELSALLQELDQLRHHDERVDRIRREAPRHLFTTRQSVVLAQQVPFSSDRIAILSLLYPRVVDPQSFDEAYRLLPMADDREALRARLEATRGR